MNRDLNFNQFAYAPDGEYGRVAYQIVDDFGDLLSPFDGVRSYPYDSYKRAWAYYANGE